MVLKHAIKINSTPERVYNLLTTVEDLNSCHSLNVSGEIALGKKLKLKDGSKSLAFEWETLILEPHKHLKQVCVLGPGDSIGRKLEFFISKENNNKVILKLNHYSWKDNDHMPYCNTHWGSLLANIKSFLENK